MPIFFPAKSPPKIESLPLIKKPRIHYIADLWEMCECNHLISGHYFIPIWGKAGHCDYDYCNCKEFKQKEFVINIIVTKLDLFKFENPNCGSEEYPQFWLDYSLWEKNASTKRIQSLSK